MRTGSSDCYKAAVTSIAGILAPDYSVNSANQYTSRTAAGVVDVLGVANPTANVTVNGNVANRRGEYFHWPLTVNNSSAAQYPTITVTSQYGATQSDSGEVFVPYATESYGYDADGNLTSDGRWTYIWDLAHEIATLTWVRQGQTRGSATRFTRQPEFISRAKENRLIEMKRDTSSPTLSSRQRLVFEYDHQGRRIRKTFYTHNGSSWVEDTDTVFLHPVRYELPILLCLRVTERQGWSVLHRLHPRLARTTSSAPSRKSPVHVQTAATAPDLLRGEFEPRGCDEAREVLKDSMGETVSQKQADELSHGVNDGWNLMGELNANSGNDKVRTYVWGLDLSGSEQGAGGVGGLLKVTDYTSGTTHHFVGYDGNGNVAALFDGTTGAATARYEYGPFGEPLRTTGTLAEKCPFRFSTKYTDNESGLVYYGYRSYNPTTGRWLSRDPIGERGGINIYAFVGNRAILRVDRLGLCVAWWVTGPNIKINSANNLSVTLTRPGPIFGGGIPGTVVTDPDQIELDPPVFIWRPGEGFTGDVGDLWSWSDPPLELKLILRFSIHGNIRGSICCVCKSGTSLKNLNLALQIDVSKTKYVTPPVLCFALPSPALRNACVAVRIVQWFGPDIDLLRLPYDAYKTYRWLQNENQGLMDAACKGRISDPWVVDIDVGRRSWDD